jgi:GNAT superfamily N-acetyltransferase
MAAVQLDLEDLAATVIIWVGSGSAQPPIELASDFTRSLVSPTSTVIGVRVEEGLAGVAIVSHDGYRGWIRNLVVASAWERRGFGSELVTGAEDWLKAKGAARVQILVPRAQDQSGLFEHLLYDVEEVTLFSRWLRT